MATWRYEISPLALKEIFSRLGNFQHSKRNFVSPRGLGISSVYGNGGTTVNFWTDQTFLVLNRPLWFQFIEHTQQNEIQAKDNFIQIAVFCYPIPRVGAFVHRNTEKIYCLFRDNEKLFLHFISFAGNTYVMRISIKFRRDILGLISRLLV